LHGLTRRQGVAFEGDAPAVGGQRIFMIAEAILRRRPIGGWARRSTGSQQRSQQYQDGRLHNVLLATSGTARKASVTGPERPHPGTALHPLIVNTATNVMEAECR